jgi:hypothetical protein
MSPQGQKVRVDMTDGFKTTEFWVTLIGVVGTLALVWAGKVPADAWVGVVGIGGGAYAIGRSIVKAKAGGAE